MLFTSFAFAHSTNFREHMQMIARQVQPDDLDAVVATITSAFFRDPLWAPAFPDEARRSEQSSQLWRLFASSAQRYPWTFMSENASAVAVWLPPGGTELTDAQHASFDDFIVGVVGDAGALEIQSISTQLEQARPAEPHFSLSLLATHYDHRGQGLGMRVLRESLQRIDELGSPAYLESSNPANDVRYQSVGFEPQDRLVMASGHVVTTMWRAGRISAP